MATEPFGEMKDTINGADPKTDTVFLSVLGEDPEIKIHEGSEYPSIDHEKFLPVYLKYLQENHDLDPRELTQRAIRDIDERME